MNIYEYAASLSENVSSTQIQKMRHEFFWSRSVFLSYDGFMMVLLFTNAMRNVRKMLFKMFDFFGKKIQNFKTRLECRISTVSKSTVPTNHRDNIRL